jgi:phospholipid/cholesterol/gamma-HCH transport system substrate-binding protein
MSSPRRRIRLTPGWWTTILIATITGGLLLCMARFAGTLNSYVPVTITSDRAGLIMESGAKVKFRGVVVGQVAGVTSQHDKISLALDLFPDQITHIPGNVGAQIRATTVFGAKYVDLVNPAVPSPRPLEAGQVLSRAMSPPR